MPLLKGTTAALALALSAIGAVGAATGEADTAQAAMASATEAPGPTLGVDAEKLSSALSCNEGAARDDNAPSQSVLLVHGTGLTPKDSWKRSDVPALTRDGYTTCTVKLPDRALDDAQISSEYVVSNRRRAISRRDRCSQVCRRCVGNRPR